jgi:CheY-like chemotaxis protein
MVATNGVQALELIAQERPDVVLSDVMMPLLDGRELCRRLKENSSTRSIPVILMSAAGLGVIKGAGADDYIEKPLNLEMLPSLLRRWAA